MHQEILQINIGLEGAQEMVGQYQALVAQMQAQVEQVEAVLPGWISLLAWARSTILVWVETAQIGLLMQGLAQIA